MTSSDYNSDERLIEKKSEELVEYILFCVLAESKNIMRKQDVNKTFLKDHTRLFKPIVKQTQIHLERVFGLRLVELDSQFEKFGIQSKFEYDFELNKRDAPSTRNAGHLAVTEIDREFQDEFKYSILMITLSLIFMNGNEMDANLFWESVKRIDIHKDEKKHKYLGDVSRYFTHDLVKEGYLEHTVVQGIEPPQHKFKWGQKARLEITKESALSFVCEIYGGVDACKPEDWVTQYKDAKIRDVYNGDAGRDQDNELETTSSGVADTTSRTQQRMDLFDDQENDEKPVRTRSKRK
jgi:hypothetical protein